MSKSDPYNPGHADGGFSLLEALVALAVLSVGAIGLLRAAEGHVDRIGRLEQRTAATWLAEAILADLRGGERVPEDIAAVQEFAGRRFDVRVDTAPTDDPELVRVDLSVRAEGQSGLAAQLTGFIEGGRRP